MSDEGTRGSIPPADRVRVGVVLERRDSDHPWQDHVWRARAVMPGGGPGGSWRLLETGAGWRRYYAGSLVLRLYPRETEGYRQNLSQTTPAVYVVLRPGTEDAGADTHEVKPFLVTVCPFEAQDYLDSGEEAVESVPMPAELAAWLQAFIDRHHVDEPFIKRKQKPKQCGVTSEPFARKPPESARER